MSKAAIEILKKRMTLEERRAFVKEAEKQNGKKWWKRLDGEIIGNNQYDIIDGYSMGFFGGKTFVWMRSENRLYYWQSIYQRFTPKELAVAFAEWCNIWYVKEPDDHIIWHCPIEEKRYTTEELYDKFIEEYETNK